MEQVGDHEFASTRSGRVPSGSDKLCVAMLVAAVLAVYGRLLSGYVLFDYDSLIYTLGEKLLIRDCLAAGRLPTVNPYILCGAPMVENIVSASLYPLNVLLLIGSPVWGVHLFVVVHYVIAALSVYVLLRGGFRLGCWVSATGAFAYAGGGYVWSVVDLGFFAAPAWLPLFFLALMRLRECERIGRWELLGAAALAMLFYCGNFQQAYDSLVFGGVLIVMLAGGDVVGGRLAQAVWLCVRALVLVLVGTLLAMPQLLPTLLAAARSYRMGGVPLAQAQAWSFPLVRLWEFLVPFFFGTADDCGYAAGNLYDKGVPWARSVFVGLPLLVGLVAAWQARRDRVVRWWWFVLVGGLVMAVGRLTPVYGVMHRLLPGFGVFRHPAKHMLWVHTAVVVLGSIGLQRVSAEPVRRLRVARGVLVLAGLVVAGWVVLGLLYFVAPGRLLASLAAGGSQWDAKRWLVWYSLQFGLSAGSLTIFSWALRRSAALRDNELPTFCAFAMTVTHLVVLSFSLTWAVPGHWLETAPGAESLLPGTTRTIYRIHVNKHVSHTVPPHPYCEDSRVRQTLALSRQLLYNAPSVHGVRAMGGFSPIVDRNYISYTNFKTRPPQEMLDLLCVSHMIVRDGVKEAELPAGVRVFARNGVDGYVILESTTMLPRLYCADRYVLADGDRAIDQAFENMTQWRQLGEAARKSSRFPPLVVSLAPPQTLDIDEAVGGDPTVEADEPGRLKLRCAGPTWLVIRDWHLPGWRATMDHGRPADIVTVDGAFMGIWVPRGHHTVRLRYRAPGLSVGFLLAGVGLLLAVGLGWRAYGGGWCQQLESHETETTEDVP